MEHLPPVTIESSHAHDLQLILRTTLSVRVLELALLSAIADLEEIGATQYKTKGP